MIHLKLISISNKLWTRIPLAAMAIFFFVSCESSKQLFEEFKKNTNTGASWVGKSRSEIINFFGEPNKIRSTTSNAEIIYFRDRWYLIKDEVAIDGDFFSRERYVINVTSYFDRESKPIKPGASIAIFSGNQNIPNNDVMFKDFAFALYSALTSLKLKKDEINPDYVILINFGISDPIVETETTIRPVFNWVPGTSQYTHGTIGNQSFSAHTSSNGYMQYAGNTITQEQHTSFKRYIALNIYDGKTLKQKEPKMVSKVIMDSVGYSADLKPVAGVMFALTKDYINESSAGRESVAISTTDPATYIFYKY